MQQIRLAFLYRQTDPFYSGKHTDNTLFHFYFDALPRNPLLKVSYYPFQRSFDVRILKENIDVILVAENPLHLPQLFKGIEHIEVPVIARAGDPHYNLSKDSPYDFKPDFCFGFFPPSYFYKYYPSNMRYEMIVHGLEPSLFNNLVPFNQRIRNKILNSGSTASTSFLYRTAKQMIKRIIRKNNPGSDPWKFYRLRTLCNKLPYVEYNTHNLSGKLNSDSYSLQLMKHAAAIAATSLYPTIKFWEIPAAGCLTFLEVTEKNDARVLGHIDGETAVFINEQNYEQKFEEYLVDPDNPKWECIANSGREYTMNNFTNDHAIQRLVQLIGRLI